MNQEKADVRDFWDRASCGEELYLAGEDRQAYQAQADTRYALEPYIPEFAGFNTARGLRVLEIGVGLGADHQRFAQAGAVLSGIDLTERAVEHTRRRLAVFGLASDLAVGDAENLQFPDESFDLVYSWGVLHHSPDMPKAIAEVWRVLKRGGGGEDHGLPQVELGRLDALGALRAARAEALATPTRDLRPVSGEPGHQGLLGG
ncbi:class I SAM-dependent methyltransferase [Lamprobacter modestohalophilus]|uniref:class I SAM-dependent methyltransferase n=1 Tax=Lamprobacter modestohalophilus TaxID=1064514 RepID=UPI001904D589|nr:class I SAM-dependent methyltransferase [Lamprobacter modestohalophilus]